MLEILHSYWFWVLLASYWVFMAGVDAMPELTATSGVLYSWLYRFLHTIAGNAKSAFASTERLQVALIEEALQKRLPPAND